MQGKVAYDTFRNSTTGPIAYGQISRAEGSTFRSKLLSVTFMRHVPQFDGDDEHLTEEVLRRAVRIQEELINSQPELLRRTAEELGLSEEALTEARRQYDAEQQLESDAREFSAQRRRHFWGQVAVFGAVNALLLGLNLVNWEGELWAMYSILGWGVLGIFPLAVVTFTKGSRYEKDFAEWRRKAVSERANESSD